MKILKADALAINDANEKRGRTFGFQRGEDPKHPTNNRRRRLRVQEHGRPAQNRALSCLIALEKQ